MLSSYEKFEEALEFFQEQSQELARELDLLRGEVDDFLAVRGLDVTERAPMEGMMK